MGPEYLRLTLDLQGDTIEEKVLGTIKKVERMDGKLFKELKGIADKMLIDIAKRRNGVTDLNYIDFTEDVLTDIPDSLEKTIPRGCRKEQLVIQDWTASSFDKPFIIATPIWDKMDLDQQALTVLHEAWYGVFIRYGATDSRSARFMNGLFASRERSNPDLAESITYMGNLPRHGADFPFVRKFVYQDKKFVFGDKPDNYFSRVLIAKSIQNDGTFELGSNCEYVSCNYQVELMGSKVVLNPHLMKLNSKGEVLESKGSGHLRSKDLIIGNLSLEAYGAYFTYKMNSLGEITEIFFAYLDSLKDGDKTIKRRLFSKDFGVLVRINGESVTYDVTYH